MKRLKLYTDSGLSRPEPDSSVADYLFTRRQPINADRAACGVAPELDELLSGEDASQVFNAAAILGMATF